MINIGRHLCDEAVIRTGSPACTSEAAGPWVLAATILGSSMAFIDGTVVNVALPALQSALGATVSQVQWIVESYALLLAALLILGGSLAGCGKMRVLTSLCNSKWLVMQGLGLRSANRL
jgi:MFS family permease